jgi:cobyrinic acid a,c-diamide synthase
MIIEAAQAVDCRMPPRPDAVDAVLIDGVENHDQFVRLQTCIEGVWGVPVVGALERHEGLRQQIACLAPGRPVRAEIIDGLAARMTPYLQLDALLKLAHRSSLPQPAATGREEAIVVDRPPTIAVAYDDAFGGYFADVLERLEHLGARVTDFSPLHDEALPEGADVVLVGCGRPEEYGDRLAENHCLLTALRTFARRGGAMYAEGGGTAYLSRTLTLEDGRTVPMADALPLAARVNAEPQSPTPIEFAFEQECWLAPAGMECRAYRGGRYHFHPADEISPLNRILDHDLFVADNVVGGRLQWNFLAHRETMERLLRRKDVSPAYASVG